MRQHMRVRVTAFVLAIVFLSVGVGRAQMKFTRKLPSVQHKTPKVKLPENVRKFELELLKKSAMQAKPLDPSRVLTNFPVTKLDYSDAVTFQRTQDGWGGCFHYAALHCMDILNEWRAPYTPDLSFRFLEYQGTVLFRQNEDRAQVRALGAYGVCSEANCHTNYDTSKLVGTGKDADGDGKIDQTWDHTLFQGATPIPTTANFAEAKRYRVHMSPPYKPTVATMKTLLCEYGPIWLSGRFHYALGIGLGEGHVVAVVGFDDDAQEFKCLNSWGQFRPADAYFALKYSDVEHVWNTTDSAGKAVASDELWEVRTLVNAADDRSTGPEAYSARVYIESSARNQLTIKVGVAGKAALTAWEMPNRVNLNDWCGDIILDMPLPDYAEQYWPPKAGPNPWFVEVSDGVPGKGASAIISVTLAKRYRNPHCKSIGAQQTETYDLAPVPQLVQDNASKTVYIPSAPQAGAATPIKKPIFQKQPTVRPKFNRFQPKAPTTTAPTVRPSFKPLTRAVAALDVTISSNNPNVHFGQTFTLTAKLVPSGSGMVSLAGHEVTFYYVHVPKVAWRNKPEEYTFVGKAKTGPDGTARLTLKSNFTTRAYAAALLGKDGNPEASSAKMVVGQMVK